MDSNNEEKKKLNTYYNLFKAYVQPTLNPVFNRFKVSNDVQGQQSIEQFCNQTFSQISIKCQYADQTKWSVIGLTKFAKIREKLINEGERLTQIKAIQMAQNYEYSLEPIKPMSTR